MTTKDLLLRLLMENRDYYLSGQSIGDELDISRSAINKAADGLRREGYEIEAVRNNGYVLRNDPCLMNQGELAFYLGDERAGRIDCYTSVISTNVTVHELAEMGEESGYAVIADEQTGGRGHKGSDFRSPAGKGIYMSYLYRPAGVLKDSEKISPEVSKLAANVLKKTAGIDASHKRSGDIMLQDKKIGGVLTEMLIEAESGYVRYVMIGIGIRPGRKVNRPKIAAGIISGLDEMFL